MVFVYYVIYNFYSNEPYQFHECPDTLHEQSCSDLSYEEDKFLYSLFLIIGFGGLIGMSFVLNYDFLKLDKLENPYDYADPFEVIL